MWLLCLFVWITSVSSPGGEILDKSIVTIILPPVQLDGNKA